MMLCKIGKKNTRKYLNITKQKQIHYKIKSNELTSPILINLFESVDHRCKIDISPDSQQNRSDKYHNNGLP